MERQQVAFSARVGDSNVNAAACDHWGLAIVPQPGPHAAEREVAGRRRRRRDVAASRRELREYSVILQRAQRSAWVAQRPSFRALPVTGEMSARRRRRQFDHSG